MGINRYTAIQTLAIIAIILSFYCIGTDATHDLVTVRSNEYEKIVYPRDANMKSNLRLVGSFQVVNGTTRDIEVYVLDRFAYINWGSGYEVSPLFYSGIVTAGQLEVALEGSDVFYVVFDNTHSNSTKEVDVELLLEYNYAFLSLPLRVWAVPIGFSIFVLISFYSYRKEKRNRPSTETYLMGFSYALLTIIGFGFFFSPQSMSWVNTLITAVNVILVIWNLHLTQRNVRTQLLHADRTKSQEKLYDILGKYEKSHELLDRLEEFAGTLDFELLPDNVRNITRNRIYELRTFQQVDPSIAQYSDEEMEEFARRSEEMEKEEWESMDPSQQHQRIFDRRTHDAKYDIRKEIKRYFAEPEEE